MALSHHLHLISEHFIALKENPILIKQCLPHLSSTKPLTAMNLFSVSMALLILVTSHNRIIQYVTFCV